MRNTGSAKLNMIIELSGVEELVDAIAVLDASHDETIWTIDSDEAPDIAATKGADFPFDMGGAIDHVAHNGGSIHSWHARS